RRPPPPPPPPRTPHALARPRPEDTTPLRPPPTAPGSTRTRRTPRPSPRPRPRPLAPAPAPSPRIAPARPALPRTWSPLAFRGSHRTAPRLRPDLDHRTRFVDDHLELHRPVVARMPGVDRLQTALCEPCPRFLVPGEAKDVL